MQLRTVGVIGFINDEILSLKHMEIFLEPGGSDSKDHSLSMGPHLLS